MRPTRRSPRPAPRRRTRHPRARSSCAACSISDPMPACAPIRASARLLACWLLAAAALAAGEVVVVVSADLPPYRSAQEALLAGLEPAQRGRTFVLDQLS